MSLHSTPSAEKPLANTVSECEANDQSDCSFQHIIKWHQTPSHDQPLAPSPGGAFSLLRASPSTAWSMLPCNATKGGAHEPGHCFACRDRCLDRYLNCRRGCG